MQRFLYILQISLKFGLIFLLAFIWLKFFLNSTLIAFFISFVIALILVLFFIILKKKNNNNTNLKIKEKEDAENMFLSLLTEKNYLDFFHKLVISRHSNCQRKKTHISISHSDYKVIFYPFIKISKLTLDDIIEIYKNCMLEKPDKLVITCNDYDRECERFIKNFQTQFLLLDKFSTYALLYKEYDFYPEITIENKKEAKPKLKDLIAYSFKKSQTKGYILSALVLLLPSIFIKLNIYYCIIGSMLLLFALISFINPKYNHKKTQAVL